MMEFAWPMVLAGAASFSLTPVARRYSLRRDLLDRPGPRRSHVGTIPRGGGPALLVALIVGALWIPDSRSLAFVAGGLAIGLLGWWEDHRPVAVRWRLLLQAGVAAAVALWWGPVESIGIGRGALEEPWLWTPLAVVAIVWLVNLFNFMDGSDGLAASQAFVSAALFGVSFAWLAEPALAAIAWVSAAAALGFLFWNWPRASIFLGDSGSLLLGWCMAFLALGGAVTESVPVWLSFIIVSPFVVDATTTLAWRLMRGARWYTPHTEHAYQYLIRMGWSHRRVLLAWIALNALLVVPSCMLVLWRPQLGLGIAAVLVVVLVGVWALVHFVMAKERLTI